jgi:hypothetical protein
MTAAAASHNTIMTVPGRQTSSSQAVSSQGGTAGSSEARPDPSILGFLRHDPILFGGVDALALAEPE